MDIGICIEKHCASQSVLPPKERYRNVAMQGAVKEIIINWFQNGMEETPGEMADLCQELFQ